MNSQTPSCPLCGSPLDGEVCPACTLQMLSRLDGFDRPTPGDDESTPEIPGLTVHEEIGEGGFGIVYRATQTDVIHRRVALKVLKPGVDTRAVLQRFSVERQALASLEHPYIARFYNAGKTAGNYPWFTMEYIEGEPITDALAARDLETILDTFLKACEAVSFAHEADILHRDLKPSNILVTANGTPKIIDFGVAKMTSPDVIPGSTLYTANELQVGTPSYTAPEKGPDIDVRSDVYALGATLYETVTGLTPPELPEPLPWAGRSSIRKIPDDLCHIIAKATHQNPDKRYPSVTCLMEDLRELRAGQRISKPTSLKIPAIIGFAAIAILGLVQWQLRGDRNPAPPKKAPLSIRHESTGTPGALAINKNRDRALATFRGQQCAILFDPRNGQIIFEYRSQILDVGSISFDESGERFLIGSIDGNFRWFSSDEGHILSPIYDATPGTSSWIVKIRSFTPHGSDTPNVLTVTPDHFARSWSEDGNINWEV
ncbi:WD40 repeat domain-containing serine/threonine protein kinase, partial [Akkermansiaceae bacterium]|nr:WD40 repeat domain-containing serine/threonine protein kinase [Akkermansiaceae bacterium]